MLLPLISGIGLGSMYGLIALGYALTFAVSRTVNFAQGATMMLGAVLCFVFWVELGWPLAAAAAAALAACALWGAAVEAIAVRPFVRSGSNAWLMATVALGIVLENAVLFTFGKEPRGMPPGLLTGTTIEISGLKVQLLSLIIPAAGVGIAIAVQLFFQISRAGKAARAVMQNAEAARLMGISVQRVITLAFAASGLLAGVAGLLIAPLFTVSPGMGTIFGIKAFAAAILGGLGNPMGMVLAGLLYGVAEAFIISFAGSVYSQILAFGFVILVLTLAPNGLFGHSAIKKV
jgi:branched-chain amino acid transport system permease protein